MGQNQAVQPGDPLTQERFGGNVRGVGVAVPAAVHHVCPAFALQQNTLPLPHIQHRYPGAVQHRLRPGCQKRQTQPQRAAAEQNARAAIPAQKEHQQQYIHGHQPDGNVRASGIHRRQRKSRQRFCHKQNIANRPRDDFSKNHRPARPERTHQTDRHKPIENEADDPQSEQIGHHANKTDGAKIPCAQRRCENHGAEGDGHGSSKPANQRGSDALPFAVREQSNQPLADARRKEINPRHAGHGQLKTHGRDDQRVANQHHHGGKGQRRRAVVFLIQQQRRQHQSAHNARAADRRGKARHRRKKQQRWKTHKGSQKPLPESNGSEQSEQNRHMQSGNSRHMANPADFQTGIYRITQARGITQQKRPGKGRGVLWNAGLQNCLNPVPQPRRDIPPRRVCMGRNGNFVHLIRQQKNAVARVIGSAFLRRGGAETELAGDGVPGFQRFVQVQICPKAVGLPFQLHRAIHADTVCRLVAVVRHPDDCVCRFSVHRSGGIQIKAVVQNEPAHSHGKAKKNRGNPPE